MTTEKQSPIFNNFTGGILTPLMKGRVDFDKYATGCLEMENMIPLPHGGVTRRPGFQFQNQTGGKDDWNYGGRWHTTRLVPYRFYHSAMYQAGNAGHEVIECMLEFGGTSTGKMIAYEDGTLVTYGGSVVEWDIPWSFDYFEDLRFVQYGNTLLIVHPKMQPQTLYRDPSAGVTTRYKYAAFQHERGPFRPRNDTTGYVGKVNALTGTTTMTHAYLGAVTSQINNSVWKFEHRVSETKDTITGTMTDGVMLSTEGSFSSPGATSSYLWCHGEPRLGGNKKGVIGVTLSGTWVGEVQLTRSRYHLLGGTYGDETEVEDWTGTVTGWSTDPIYERDVYSGFYRLKCQSLTSGTVGYQLVFYEPEYTAPIEVPPLSTVNVSISDGWYGNIAVERSWDNGANWDTWDSHSASGSTSVNQDYENVFSTTILVRLAPNVITSGTATYTLKTLKTEAGWGTILITGYSGVNTWTCEVEEYPDREIGVPQGVFSTQDTWRWSEGCWSDLRGWPTQVAFFEDRLVLAANPEYPNRIWMSKTGDYTNFEITDEDDSAIDITLNSDGMEHIVWMRAEKYLIVGTNEGEWRVGASEANQPVTTTNISAKMQTNYGSKDWPAIKAGKNVLFLSESGRSLYELTSDWGLEGFEARDLSILAENITVGGFKRIVYQREPHKIIWLLRNDGVLVGLTYMPQEKIYAWHIHPTATSSATSEITDIAILPGTYGDDLWLTVNRKLLGSSGVWPYLEKMGPFYNGSNAHACCWLDCSNYENKTSGTTVNADSCRGWDPANLPFNHGELVSYIYAADGAETTLAGWQTSGTDTTYDQDGVGEPWDIEIGTSDNVHVWNGLSYTSKIKTMPIELQTERGSTMGKEKDIKGMVLRVYEAFDTMTVGRESASAEAFALPTAYDYDGDVVIDAVPSGYDSDSTIYVAATGAGAFTLLALMPEISVNKM